MPWPLTVLDHAFHEPLQGTEGPDHIGQRSGMEGCHDCTRHLRTQDCRKGRGRGGEEGIELEGILSATAAGSIHDLLRDRHGLTQV